MPGSGDGGVGLRVHRDADPGRADPEPRGLRVGLLQSGGLGRRAGAAGRGRRRPGEWPPELQRPHPDGEHAAGVLRGAGGRLERAPGFQRGAGLRLDRAQQQLHGDGAAAGRRDPDHPGHGGAGALRPPLGELHGVAGAGGAGGREGDAELREAGERPAARPAGRGGGELLRRAADQRDTACAVVEDRLGPGRRRHLRAGRHGSGAGDLRHAGAGGHGRRDAAGPALAGPGIRAALGREQDTGCGLRGRLGDGHADLRLRGGGAGPRAVRGRIGDRAGIPGPGDPRRRPDLRLGRGGRGRFPCGGRPQPGPQGRRVGVSAEAPERGGGRHDAGAHLRPGPGRGLGARAGRLPRHRGRDPAQRRLRRHRHRRRDRDAHPGYRGAPRRHGHGELHQAVRQPAPGRRRQSGRELRRQGGDQRYRGRPRGAAGQLLGGYADRAKHLKRGGVRLRRQFFWEGVQQRSDERHLHTWGHELSGQGPLSVGGGRKSAGIRPYYESDSLGLDAACRRSGVPPRRRDS